MKIAVLVYDLTIEYNVTVVEGIVSFFEDKKDVKLIISPTNIPNYSDIYYNYQYWSSAKLLESDDIDAYIIVPNSYGNYREFTFFKENLEKYSNRPVVSVGTPLNFPKNYNTYNSCQKAYEQVIEHLVKQHNCKKIGFFSAGLINSEESVERETNYRLALEKFGLEYNPDFILKGDFTPGTARDVFLAKYKSKEEIPFDALLCANDHTAAGCFMAFAKLGVKVPDDIIVIGYDNMEIGLISDPTLSTIDQYVSKSGYEAASIVYDVLKGKKVSRKRIIEAAPIYRQSCGCVSDNTHTAAYVDKNGTLYDNEGITKARNISAFVQSNDNLTSIYRMLNMMDANESFDEGEKIFIPHLHFANIQVMAVSFYQDPLNVMDTFPYEVPEKANLSIFYNESDINHNKFTDVNESEDYYNPMKELIPPNIPDLGGGTYFLLPIFVRTKNFGYIICKFNQRNLTLISIYAKILTNLLIQSFEYSRTKFKNARLVQHTQNLSVQSKTDELTQLFNRRGLFDYGQGMLELAISTRKTGSVFFCDMDGLKKINDTYGHQIGDAAIKGIAEVLKRAFRDSDLIGRLSGDEFGIIAPGFKIEKIQVLRDRIDSLCKEISEREKFPFILSLSIGAIEFDESKSDLDELFRIADKNLYEEKKIKHAKMETKKQ